MINNENKTEKTSANISVKLIFTLEYTAGFTICFVVVVVVGVIKLDSISADRDQNDNQSPGSRSSCSRGLMQNATKCIFGTQKF
jgi:hypothetical protein